MHKDNGITKLGGKGELSLEESNNARIQALNAIGVGINGINDALTIMMLEELLGEEGMERVHQRHQQWLAEQLDVMEEKVLAEQRKQQLTIPGRNMP